MGIKNSIIYNIMEFIAGLKKKLILYRWEDFKDRFTAYNETGYMVIRKL